MGELCEKNLKNVCPYKLYFHIQVFLFEAFVSWDSNHFKLRLTLESLYFKNTDKKWKGYYKNVTIYNIIGMGYKKMHYTFNNSESEPSTTITCDNCVSFIKTSSCFQISRHRSIKITALPLQTSLFVFHCVHIH